MKYIDPVQAAQLRGIRIRPLYDGEVLFDEQTHTAYVTQNTYEEIHQQFGAEHDNDS